MGRILCCYGGTVGDGGWKIPDSAPVGLGQLDLHLDPFVQIQGLAITIAADATENSDLSIHLYDPAGELIAVDLFGNLFDSARSGQTDTFIVSLAKYPETSRVSIRRIKGPLALRGIVAFPVVEAFEDLSLEQKRAFAKLLGDRLSSWGEPASIGTQPIQSADNRSRTVATRSVLNSATYRERFWREPLPATAAFAFACGGSCYRFATNLYLSLFPHVESAEKVSFVSSTTAMEVVISSGSGLALTSVPPSAAEFTEFQSRWSRPLLVVPVALDAVEVIVHPSNQLTEVSFTTLRRLFTGVPPQRPRWEELTGTGLAGPIQIAGGYPSWGTSRLFSERVLGGQELSSDLVKLDIAFPHGVEAFVAKNPNAVGFAQHRIRTHPVKSLRLSENGPSLAVTASGVNDGSYPLSRNLYLIVAPDASGGGLNAILHFADLLLSREGQSAIAEAGSFPMSAQAIENSRRQLGLP